MGTAGARRSARVLADVSVLVRGELNGNGHFQEETFTVTVSAHGAMLMLAAKVALGQTITIATTENRVEQVCRVAYKGPDRAGLAQVGVEFSAPAPGFWPVDAPASWKIA